MKYVEFINSAMKAKISQEEGLVLFGQNISAGSCLSGLTRNLKVGRDGLIINTPNCENTLCGVGFGLMISGTNSIFFMKQQVKEGVKLIAHAGRVYWSDILADGKGAEKVEDELRNLGAKQILEDVPQEQVFR